MERSPPGAPARPSSDADTMGLAECQAGFPRISPNVRFLYRAEQFGDMAPGCAHMEPGSSGQSPHRGNGALASLPSEKERFPSKIFNGHGLYRVRRLEAEDPREEVELPFQGPPDVVRLSKTMLLARERHVGRGDAPFP